MESLIISYSLFEPKSLHKEMRTWDVHNREDRYWYNIPAMICVNSIVYPKAKIKIYVSDNIRENPIFSILERSSKEFENLEIIHMSYDYVDTEPSMWRYKPVFDKESNIVLCRDIDSLPNIDEIRATYYFLENKEFYLQTLRTHRNHVIPHTIILAGLCGFRPKDTYFLNDITFEMYYNSFKNNPWGVDQSSLINVFIRDREWLKNRFLDCPITTDHHYVGPPLVECRSIQKTSYLEEKDFSYIDSDIINLLEQETTWAGEPTNFRGEKLIKLLSIDNTYTNIMRNILETSSEEIKKFYLNV